jgi:hypothetical protein
MQWKRMAVLVELEMEKAFYFPGIHKSFKFSRLPIMAIISVFYGLRIPRTTCTGTPLLTRFSYFYGQYGQV